MEELNLFKVDNKYKSKNSSQMRQTESNVSGINTNEGVSRMASNNLLLDSSTRGHNPRGSRSTDKGLPYRANQRARVRGQIHNEIVQQAL